MTILSVISAGVGIALRFFRKKGRQAEETGKRPLQKIFSMLGNVTKQLLPQLGYEIVGRWPTSQDESAVDE
jgi:hypothetical protein